MNKSALYRLSYGVYIVSSEADGKLNGQVSNAVFQITADPIQVEALINKQNLTNEIIHKRKRFTVAILDVEAPMVYIGRFGFKSGRNIEKFNDEIKYMITESGLPVPLDYTVSHLECEVVQEIDVGTHTAFVGKLVDCEVHSENEPMTYAYYHTVKKGKEPETASVYIKEDK